MRTGQGYCPVCGKWYSLLANHIQDKPGPEHQAYRTAHPHAESWHRAPDGSPCRCTAEDRRYGCGCI